MPIQTTGANFVRADLHIHSYGENGSFDVKDESNTPESIVDTALAKGLSIISITDHNNIGNSEKAVGYSFGKDVLVIPGIEISTTQGHLLAYFESPSNLKSFYSKLSISPDFERCHQGIKECLDLIDQYNGFAILAHIELDSGFEKTIGRFSKVMDDIICHKALCALEISSKQNAALYTDVDDSADRKRLVNERREKLDNGKSHLPKVMSSDSHSLDKLGCNADGESKLTRFKVDELTFHSVRIAFQLSESRVRIESLIPENYPRFVKLDLSGGLLDSQCVSFSPNLTCIIGGRGAGKSTLLESLRVSSGNKSTGSSLDSEVWPESITLLYKDETGREIEFRRDINSTTINTTDVESGIERVEIESYGQGETAATIQHSDSNPVHLSDFLDSFIQISADEQLDKGYREQLQQNRIELKAKRIELSSEPEVLRTLKDLEAKKERLEKDQVGELVSKQTALTYEKSLRKNIYEKIIARFKQYSDILGNKDDFAFVAGIEIGKILVGKAEIQQVQSILSKFEKEVDFSSAAIKKSSSEIIGLLNVELRKWHEKEAAIISEIDKKKKELEAAGIPVDLAGIRTLATELERYRAWAQSLAQLKVKVKELEAERRKLVLNRKDVKERIYQMRMAFGRRVNEDLKSSVDGFTVTLKYKEGCYSTDFEDAIKGAMEWRTTQVKRAFILSSNMSPLAFCDHVRKRNKAAFSAILDAEKRPIFQENEIDAIFEKMADRQLIEEFESLSYRDLPQLTVTKTVTKETGEVKHVTRSISQLSLGQQQSILLAILIQSNSKIPLLIDQPEDNLDSEFIYKTIVTNLKRIKETRQVVIVTHNANIAVLGDAELVVPLKSTSTISRITSPGSIDCKATRELCCDILEGGKQAFGSRRLIYGIN